MSKLVYGKGFNDKTRPAKVDGKIVKEYDLWQSMLSRFIIVTGKQIGRAHV